MTICAKDPALAVMTNPTSTAASVAIKTRLRLDPSPRRPITGVAIAPTSIVTVSIHCASSRLTFFSAAMSGISGVPSVETTDMVSAATMRTRMTAESDRPLSSSDVII